MTMFLKVEHKNSKADINFENLIFKHTLIHTFKGANRSMYQRVIIMVDVI